MEIKEAIVDWGFILIMGMVVGLTIYASIVYNNDILIIALCVVFLFYNALYDLVKISRLEDKISRLENKKRSVRKNETKSNH